MCTQDLCGADWGGYVRPIISNATGKYIKENTPFDMTFIVGYCNGSGGYLPSRRAYDYFSYEVGCSNFAEGVAEEHAAFMAQSLNELKQNERRKTL